MTLFEKFQRIYSRIEAYPKPLIAAINGVAIGGGLELALVCDLRVASEVAYFSMPELKHGIIPGLGATQRLSRFIGVGRAKEMLFLGKMIRAETALAWGLVDRLVPRDRVLHHRPRDGPRPLGEARGGGEGSQAMLPDG